MSQTAVTSVLPAAAAPPSQIPHPSTPATSGPAAMPQAPAAPPKKSLQVVLATTPDELSRQAKDIHLSAVGSIAIGAIADVLGFVKAPDSATATTLGGWFLNELYRSIKPSNAIEEMLIVQMALVHQRIVNLSVKAADQVHRQNVAVVNHALDQACNTFRKQMLALNEYRRARPPKPAAEEQDYQHESGSNELGSEAAPAQAALPALTDGIAVPPHVGASPSALAMEHGPANGSGEVSLKAQRAKARGVQPLAPRRAPATKRVDPATARRRRRAP